MAKIIVHTLVKNEERFVWYALQSVLPYVDKIMVWDTGSTETVEIIKSIASDKIQLKELGKVDSDSHTQARQQMLDETPKGYDWLMVLDGDEIWPESAIKKVKEALDKNTKAVFVRTRNWVGDLYHHLPESAGQYEIGGIRGHLNLRFINLSLPHLKISNPHGGQTMTSNGMPVQEIATFVDTYYYHATHLVRSSDDDTTLKRTQKRKYELGANIPKNELPEILWVVIPKNVPSIVRPMPLFTHLICLVQTVPRRIRRAILPMKSGYI